MRVTGIFALLLATSALAQTPPKPEPLEVPGVAVPPPGGLDLQPLAPPKEQLAPARPVFVRSFRVVGAAALEAELAALLAPWTGRELSSDDLRRAADAVTTHLRAKGLIVAQAVVPPQQVRDGVVEMRVLEGRVGAVRLEVPEDSRVRRSLAEWFLKPIQPGEVIRRDNVENNLLLLNDLPGIRLEASLSPGTELGTVDVNARLRDETRPVSGRLTFDDAGLPATGEYRGTLDLRLASPLGFGDLLSSRLLYSNTGGQKFGMLTYGVPITNAGTRLGIRYAEQRYRLGKEFEALNANGTYRSTSLLANHPLLRRSDQNLVFGFSWTEFDFEDRIDAVGSVIDTQQRVALFALAGDETDRWLGGGLGTARLQYLRGKVILDPNVSAADASPGGLGVAGWYSVYRLRLHRNQNVDPRSNLIVVLTGQIANKNLDAGPEIEVGGPDAVRAYPVGELYADDGVLGRVEYHWRFAPFHVRSSLSLFYDAMRVRVNHDPLAGDSRNLRSFAGYGFGFAVTPLRDVSVQTWFAWRAGGDEPRTAGDRSPRIWGAISARF